MTSSPHGLYVQGYTRATMASTNRCKPAMGSQSEKARLSSDWSLQLDSMKLESLVLQDKNPPVNRFRGLYQPPLPSRKVGVIGVGAPNPKGGQRPREYPWMG